MANDDSIARPIPQQGTVVVLSPLDGRVVRHLMLQHDIRFSYGGMVYTHRDTLLLACRGGVVELNPITGELIRRISASSLPIGM